MNLKSKSNKILVVEVKEKVANERELLIEILHYLLEIEDRKLYLEMGFPSLFAFVTEELGYSEASAQRRIQAMRLIRDVPQVEEKLESGKLSLSVAAQIQGFIRKEEIPQSDKLELIETLEGTSSRECEKKLITIAPETSLPKEKTKIITQDKVMIQFIADKEMMNDIERLKFLLSHQNYEGRYDQLFKRTLKMALEQIDPERREARRKTKAQKVKGKNFGDPQKSPENFPSPMTSTPTSEVKSRHIPQSTRDKVWIRDQGRCQYKDLATGKICNSQHTLQIDHRTPYAYGGDHSLDNLQLLCGVHNRHQAKKEFGEYRNFG